MDRRSAGLKDYFVVRRRLKTGEEDGTKKAAVQSSKSLPSPKAGLSVLQSPVRQSHKPRTSATSSPSKRTRDVAHSSSDNVAPKLERFDFIEFDSPTKKEKRSAGRSELPLPKSYQYLAEQFRCTDMIVDMLRRRQEMCTFTKLRRAVEEMSGKAFSMKTLSQMKMVYPRALTHHYDSNVPGTDPSNRSKHQLIISANMEERALDFSSASASKATHFSSSSFIHRRRVFHRGLLSLVKEYHRTFLAALEPPLEIPDRDVFRWHEDFDLDSVPEVEEADMPKHPSTEETVVSAKQLLLSHVMSPRARHSASAATATATAEKCGTTGTPEKSRGDATPTQGTPVKPGVNSTPEKRVLSKDSGHLQGVSRKLIEKIQEKEAARARLEIMRGPGEVKELRMLDTSMKIVPILKAYFLLEKKAAVPLHSAVAKIQESYSSQLSQDFVEETLQYLVTAGISWIQIVAIKNRKYVKVDRSADINVVLKKIEELKKQHFKVPT